MQALLTAAFHLGRVAGLVAFLLNAILTVPEAPNKGGMKP